MVAVNKPVLIEEMSLEELYKAHYEALVMLRNLQQQADVLNNQIAAINQAIEQKKQMAEEAITAQFEIIRVQTMASGAVRVVLEASEKRTDLLQIFADIRRDGGLLEAAMLAVIPEQGQDDRKINF